MLPDGWLPMDEAEALKELARGRTVLELGAWKGRSTTVLSDSARYVVSVDRHQGIPGHGGDSLSEYLENVRSLPNVAIVVAHFQEIIPFLGAFDLVYIDGDHTAEPVARDTALARAHATEIIAFHDWDFASVSDTVRGIFKREPDSLVGSLAAYRL